jgi:5'-3' exoribonuclease 1
MEGLQWVMNYYFKGASDWQWFYPFHYAPMISDFVNFQIPNIQFERREPFMALEQLLGVIPPGSKTLLPKPYALLTEDPELVSFFPEKPGIEYDPMCAKIGWESLKIKVPFVPYEEIMRKTRNFTESFENNAVGGDLLIEYNPREPVLFVASLIPSLFPDFDCRIKEELLTYSQDSSFLPLLIQGTSETLPGFPNLNSVPFIHNLRAVGVNKFQGSSSRESIILEFQRSEMSFKQACDTLYNKTFFFEYPNAEYGLVMGLSTETEVYPKLTAKDLEYYEMTEEQYLQSVRSSLESQLLFAQGIQIKPVLGIVVHYYPLSQIKKTLKGKYTAEWSNSENFSPLELIIHNRLPGHPRDLASPSSIQEEFPLQSRVILLKKEKQGYLGEVAGYAGPNVQIRIIKKPKSIISDIQKLATFHEEKYYSVKEVSQKVHKPIGLVNKVMSSIKIKIKIPGKTKVLEIGLNLKHDRDYVSALRWARWGAYWKTSDDWEYSAQALHILESYIENFPGLWSRLENCWSKNKRNFNVDDLFNYSKPASREAERVALWVCKQPSYREPWATLYSEYLCESVVDNLAKLASTAKNELADEMETVNPSQIYSPTLPWCPVFSDKVLDFKLGHRVMNLNPYFNHYIPFAAEGTITALLDLMHAEVLWDDYIIKNKRIVVPTQNLFNLSVSFLVLKRGNIEKMPLFRANSYNDSNFRPETFKKKAGETPEEILTRAMSDLKVGELKLNPDANEFILPRSESEIVPPSGLEFPIPSFK